MNPTTAALLLPLLFGAAASTNANCSQIPDVPNALLQEPRSSYTQGQTLVFTCDKGYVSGRPIKYICSDDGQIVPLGRYACRPKPCVLPDDIPNGYYLITEGNDFVFGTEIKYICNEGYQMMSGTDTRTCFSDGWSNHLPVCEPLSCDPPPSVPGLTVEGLPFNDEPILPDRFLTFSCPEGFTVNGSQRLVCGSNGKWDEPFPNCMETIIADNPAAGGKGPAGGSGHCGPPPPLENGDFFTSASEFPPNTKVKYECQSKYKMQGGPSKTCLDGAWSGNIICLKPCTVNDALLEENKIEFRWGDADKLYAPHLDFLEFLCVKGARPDRAVSMRQQCHNGRINLPRCVTA